MVVFIPEEILALGLLLFWRVGSEDWFHSIWVVACVEHLGSYGHGGGREILHLLKLIAHLTGNSSQLGHILLVAARMGADEIRDDLLA